MGVATIVFRKKIPSVIPPPLFATILIITSILYVTFMTADYQTPRYFLPVLFIWETVLPIYIFLLVPCIKFKFVGENLQKRLQKIMEYFFAGLLILIPFIFFSYGLWIIWLYHFLP
jgi:hypothetical protein